MNTNMATAQPISTNWPGLETMADDEQYREYHSRCWSVFVDMVEQENLSKDILPQFENVYLPLTAWVASKHIDKPLVIGINGAQGSGKSTLCKILESFLSTAFNKKVVSVSIDDLYLSRQERNNLANDIHPLLSVRGVPGTHDVSLGTQILSELTKGVGSTGVTIPVFSKADDDRLPEHAWRVINQSPDIILFEGWCVGAQAQHESELKEPLNELEVSDDSDARWRQYVNTQLAGPYQSLFSYIDYLVMLKVPDMESVFEWRGLQEEKLASRCKQEGRTATSVMTPAEVSRFIMYYERITRSCLDEMPHRAHVLLELNKQHQVSSVSVRDEV